MPLFRPQQRALAEDVMAIGFANPFLPERISVERRILGPEHVEVGDALALSPDDDANPNTARILERVEACLRDVHAALLGGQEPEGRDLELFQSLALFTLYHRWRDEIFALAKQSFTWNPGHKATHLPVPWATRFREEALVLLRPRGLSLPDDPGVEHVLSFFFQLGRAFQQIYRHILGTSPAAVRLRASVWQSIFSHDHRRYLRTLYRHMADLTTLITGPSGTGKELVALAVGSSGYVPFDPASDAFPISAEGLFLALNLAALSPALIESELFGHRRGSFTGALEDRQGWFEACPKHGAVFLDEIGEIAPEIQSKLLRVLQTRRFQRLGDVKPRCFEGKLISATNRDLAREISVGNFREDLYFRLCSDRIVTPSLAEQVQGSMEELHHLVLFVAGRLVGEEAESLAGEVVEWVEHGLGRDYPWPGNFRELEQCVRNVLVRKEYEPRTADRAASPDERLAREFLAADLSAEEMLRRYCTLAYAKTGSYEGAARRLGLDRRTVKAKLDPELLERLASE